MIGYINSHYLISSHKTAKYPLKIKFKRAGLPPASLKLLNCYIKSAQALDNALTSVQDDSCFTQNAFHSVNYNLDCSKSCFWNFDGLHYPVWLALIFAIHVFLSITVSFSISVSFISFTFRSYFDHVFPTITSPIFVFI